MAKSLNNLLGKISPEVKSEANKKAAQLLAEMTLSELRKSREITQSTVADTLGLKQANISQLEKRDDVYISTLRNYLKAIGGHLDLVVRFNDGEEVIINNQFNEPRAM